MSQYEAGSLEDIAQMFDRFATSAADQAAHRPTKSQKQFELGRASSWRDAANMLRKTTIKAEAA